MKNIFITFCLCLFTSLSAWSGISIVSDLDDTIKITNSGQEIEATINGLFSDKMFVGMPEFFKAARHYTNEVHVLTASPIFLKPLIQKAFREKGIETDSLITKMPFPIRSNLDYKVLELKKIFEKSSDDFILIGDDVGHDPEAYDILKKLYPNRVLAIYIHAIQGRSLPGSSFQYWTAFDIFLKEFLAGRMLKSSVSEAADLLFEEKDVELIFPKFAKCPQGPEVWAWQIKTPFVRDGLALAGKFSLYCLARRSSI